MTQITFKPTDKDNFDDIISLKVAPDQDDYIDSNLYSIAYSKVHPSLATYGIYANDTLVGFAQFGEDPKKDRYKLAEIMIDIKYQSKGYGQIALKQVIDNLKQDQRFKSLVLTLVPENEIAKNIYLKFGFVFIDEVIIEDELTMQLDL
ncbi:MAG: GNAT family N-acetyltransferase [Candidatus Cloacimonetes bacterium]|nr:GNAT family N-acetyltransferase [Candidatus Cloacimonadota bacterium]